MDEKTIGMLRAGAEIVFENAVSLYEEASVLTKAGALTRAHFLHQISTEECAKVEMLGVNAMGLLMGRELDLEKIAEKFRHHKHKNKINSYFLTRSARETRAKTTKAAAAAFELVQNKF